MVEGSTETGVSSAEESTTAAETTTAEAEVIEPVVVEPAPPRSRGCATSSSRAARAACPAGGGSTRTRPAEDRPCP
jgi:hypothetical protein